MKLDLSKPLYAVIFDCDAAREEEQSRIVRQVEAIEFPCKHHDNTVIWYSGGFRSTCFDFLPQEVTPNDV